MMTEAMERMIKGRVGLLAREPFFAHLAMSKIELVEDAKCKTTWCDGRRLGFNPEHVLAIDSMHLIESVWAHHIATCALGHPFRRGARDEAKWNDASDHVVNSFITKAGFELPEGSLYDPRFDGMYAEQVYAELLKEEQEDDDGDEQGEGGGAGTGGGRQPGDGQPDPEAGAGAEPADGEGDSSAGAGADATGEVRDASRDDGTEEGADASPAERAEQEADWQTAIAQAEQASRAAGKLGGGTERLAKATMQPKVDWREALQRLIRAKSKDDFSMKPNRLFYHLGYIVPSLDAPRCGPLAFAIDYSGSITQSLVDQFASEVEDARQTVNPESIVVYIFDYGIRRTLTFESGEPVELPPVSAGGGTSFVHPVLAANELEVEPEVLVFLTDLYSSSFAPEPSYPVVWCTIGSTSAPYGEVIAVPMQ